jgi:hypothetical protein
MVVGVSEEPPANEGQPIRDPAAVITDFLNQYVPDEPVVYDRPDARTLIRWLREEGWQITPIRVK